jgi:hypothetical protein
MGNWLGYFNGYAQTDIVCKEAPSETLEVTVSPQNSHLTDLPPELFLMIFETNPSVAGILKNMQST